MPSEKVQQAEKQKQDLQELMKLPEDVRMKLIYIAAGMLMGAQVQAQTADRSA